MLNVSPAAAASNLADAIWIDLIEPTDEERDRVHRATTLCLPTKADIEEIESSSRVYAENGALYLSSPVLEHTDCLNAVVTAVGFVLSPDKLVTQRFGRVAAFDTVAAAYAKAPPSDATDVFLKILETVVDNLADTLEHASAELERISHASFRADHPRRNRAKSSEALRGALSKLGRMGDGISHVRDTLLGFGRIAAFLRENGNLKIPPAEITRSEAIRTDIASLNDYQAHLANKVQFLLDATLGFINIEQNDVVKTLTVVSVVGVPPVLIAGIYGMNFKNMPELDWPFGYPFALILIVVSGFLPLAWFKRRGWL
jgi:magnesium transporter